MYQIYQSHGTRLQMVCFTCIYLREQRDKGFCSNNIEDKMKKELLSEFETQGKNLETMRDEMETFKGAKSDTSGGKKYLNMMFFHCGMPGLYKGGKKFCQWKDLSQAESRENGMRFVIYALQAAN
jgi:hypothetical protein